MKSWSAGAAFATLVLLIPCSFPAYAGQAEEAGAASPHEYTVAIRPALWIVMVDGKISDPGPHGDGVEVKLDDNLGFDDPFPVFLGEANLRLGGHDFWITGTSINETELVGLDISFEIDDVVFEFGTDVKTKMKLTDINFKYGYSPFSFEDDGFRLGPTIAVSYTKFKFALTEQEFGANADVGETVPVPTVGLHGEVPIDEVILMGSVSGIYYKASDFEGINFRASANVTWRPFENFGVFAGINAIMVSVKVKNTEIDNALLWGPFAGVELRF